MFYRSINAKAMRVIPFVIALAAFAILMLPGDSVQAQPTATTVQYNENGTDSVITLTATDPEMASPILWSLLRNIPNDPAPQIDGVNIGADDIEDHEDFKISADGVLEFENKPDYEDPADVGTNNEYKVVVQASDGSGMNWHKVTVRVMDVEEEGSLKLMPEAQTTTTLLQPQVGVEINAHSLTDPDGIPSETRGTSMISTSIPLDNAKWQWYRTSSRTVMGTEIDGVGAESAAYRPRATSGNSDVGQFLRVVATYTDGRGRNKTATAVSEYVTIGIISDNTAPEFPSESTARAMPEEMPKGTPIGNPVTATDMDSADILTYWLGGTGEDNALFDIDARTGQLKVKTKLNSEGPMAGTDRCQQAANQCLLTVNVADSSGTTSTDQTPAGTDVIDVTITVSNVDEKPTFDSPSIKAIVREEGDTGLMSGDDEVEYTATDPEGAIVTLTLSGDDGDKFELTDTVALNDTAKQLDFKEKPDFENPGDMNEDNVYEVTVVASDGANAGMLDVTIKVTDMPEVGEIKVVPAQPRTGTQLTADLTDGDDVVSGPTWQWYKQVVNTAPTVACPVETRNSDGGIDTTTWAKIKDATSGTYTPVSDDNGACLLVVADYVDGFYANDEMMFDRSVDQVLPGRVLGSSTNIAPEFDGTTAIRYVPEDAATGDLVGKPVTAKDDPMPTYQLSGPDAGSFDIDLNTGQITVKANAKLDHETKPTHRVTVTATDSNSASDTLTVTIHVTDVDEAPAPMEYEEIVDYAENDTVRVITLTATDPEMASPILWSLLRNIPNDPAPQIDGVNIGADDIEDHEDFKISADGVLEFENKPDYEDPADVGTNNEYKVVVQASDGSGMNWHKVTVRVMDVEEEGSLKLMPEAQTTTTLLQPQVGVAITAADLADPDGSISSPTYQWYRTSSRTATGTEISDADEADYLPKATAGDSDVGRYLRVVATYTDRRAGNKTATAVSDHVTIREIANNTAPEFPSESTARAMPEEMPKGTPIGNPVTATDMDSADILTYWLGGTGEDNALFDIDARTGQLKVKTKLNSEGPMAGTDRCQQAANQCLLTVNVADSSGTTSTDQTPAGTDVIDVTITVSNVDEKPTFDSPSIKAIVREEGDTGLMSGDDEVEYTATDPEGAIVTLTLSGDDGDKFELTDTVALNDTAKQLDFKEKPDFENPGDMNEDNVYEVTVVASDGANAGMLDVTIKVTDMPEVGEIKVVPAQPRTGTQLTADLTDGDDVVSGPTWQWYKQVVNTAPTVACPVETRNSDGGIDTTTWAKIKDATSGTYTPVSDDNGACLLVVADYVDGFYANDEMMFDRSVDQVLPGRVLGSSTNIAPEFDGTTAIRYVPEDAATGDLVGKPVTAKDDPMPTYQLSGPDAGSFDIGETPGQITVKANAKLDHETKPTHTVTVTATDPHNASDTITVTIHVTDVDEAPRIFEGSLMVSGQASADYAENGMGAVATYMAAGTNADAARWSLSGDDMSAFTISGGVLMFRTTPNYENPADMDEDNTYVVMVKAAAGSEMDTVEVTVSVTNVEETGMVNLSDMSPLVDGEVMATLTDSDVVVDSSVRWQWSKSMDMSSWMDIPGAASNAYTPVEADGGYYLQATASYTDGYRTGNSAMAMTASAVYTTPDQAGTVSLSPTAPKVGDDVTASLADPDGSVTGMMWQWSRSMDMTTWMDIADANSATYTVMEMDDGYYLRATVSYTDAHGAGKDAMMVTASAVVASLVDRYDTDGSGTIDKAEVIDAINDYLFPEGDETITKAQVIDLINLYLFGPR